MQLAKAVASAAAALVLKAKNVAQRTEDTVLQTQVIAAATQCALSTSQLVACTKVSDGGASVASVATRASRCSSLEAGQTLLLAAIEAALLKGQESPLV